MSASKAKILVVDDHAHTRTFLQTVLQDEGYQVSVAENGAAALKLAGAELPNLILLDIMMPEMDGYQVAAAVRANPKTKHIPILLCTAKHLISDVERGFAAGANDFISKPFEIASLLMKVIQLLNKPKP